MLTLGTDLPLLGSMSGNVGYKIPYIFLATRPPYPSIARVTKEEKTELAVHPSSFVGLELASDGASVFDADLTTAAAFLRCLVPLAALEADDVIVGTYR